MNNFPVLFAQNDLQQVAAEHVRDVGFVTIMMMIGGWLFWPCVVLLIGIMGVVWFMKGKIVKVVKPHQRAIKTRRGRFHSLRRPGFAWMIPFWDHVEIITLSMLEVPIKEETLRTKPEEGYFLKLYGNVFYQIKDAGDALRQISNASYQDSPQLVQNILDYKYSVDDLPKLIERLAKDHLRSVVAKKGLSQIFVEKDAIATDLREHLSTALNNYGVVVVNTPITDVVLPDDVVSASNKRLTAEREGDARIIAATKSGEAMIITAKNEKEAAQLEGTGTAARYEERAKGLQKAMQTLTGEDITISVAGAVAFMLEAERYQTFGNLAASGKGPATVFLPYTPGMSDETLSTITAIVASQPAELQIDQLDHEQHQLELEAALEKARKEERQDVVEVLERQKQHLARLFSRATQATGDALAKRAGRIPIVGKRLAKGVRNAAEAATKNLDDVS